MNDEAHFTWRYRCSGNPNKAWIVSGDGNKKLSPLMSTKAAEKVVSVHNQAVLFLLEHNKEATHD